MRSTTQPAEIAIILGDFPEKAEVIVRSEDFLANESDCPSGSNTLPAPELNPLTHPVLAENLRRWAEVYFGNPPEQRDRAVLKLVQELEREKVHSDQIAADSSGIERPGSLARSAAEPGQTETVRCPSCGHDNTKSQRFCGMCGASVRSEQPQSPPMLLDRIPAENWDLQDRRVYDQDEAEGWRSEPESSSTGYDSRGYEEPAPNDNELSLFQSVPPRDYDAPDWDYKSSTRQPYRIYIGIVLAAILAGLGYMAWRGTQGNSLSHEASPPPPAVAKEVATPPVQPADTQPADTAKAVPPSAAKDASGELPDGTPKAIGKAKARNTKQHLPSKPIQAAESEKLAASQRGKDKGEEELSIAEGYLSGTTGKRRDTAEASTWLWRSVAKHNDKATLLLADLYLRGDGVSKNCDQARVLLDSAARKGMSGAGERLRNLQAFGCQ